MWKCIGLLLFLGQWIIVASESNETPGIRNTRNTECCPCPEGKSADLTASATTHVIDDCPCKARSADSDPAASIFTPVFRAVHPPSRQSQEKDLKPLLEPEVDLASSVLETLREATEEEYQEALARDAARNAVQDDINKFVKIVVNPESGHDDAEPEASNSHSVRCVDPLDNNSFLGRSSLQYPNTDLPNIAQIPLLGRTHDMHEAANNFHRTFDTSRSTQFPDSVTYKRPLQTVLKTPVYERDLFVSPSDNINRFVKDYEHLPVSSFLTLGRNNLFKQLDLRNILNLDKVPSLVPNEIINENHIGQLDGIRHAPSHFHDSTLDEVIAETRNPKNCITADNISNDDENSVETKILNSIPRQDSKHLIQTKSSENTDLYEKDTSIKSDGTVEESQNNIKMLSSPDKYDYKFVSGSLDSKDENAQFQKNMPLAKDSITQTLDDFREANAAMYDNLKSSLDNILPHNSARMATNGDYNKFMNPNTLGPRVRNNNFEESGLNVKDIENNSNIPNDDKDVTLKSSERNAFIQNNLDNKKKQTLSLRSNQDTDPTYDVNGDSDRRSSIHKSNNENTDTCLVYGPSQSKNANSDQNEMKMAASEPFYSRYGIPRIPESNIDRKLKNSLNIRTPMKTIEDINLDIFDFQPFSSDKVSARNNIESLPRLNMKSYKTRVPIPQSLDLKPVKLQKAFRKGNDILGAVLTIKPHSEEKSNNMRSSQTKGSHNIFEHPLGMLPSFDDIRSFLDHNAKNILKLPHLSKNVGTNLASPLLNIEDTADHLRTYTEDAFNNVQQTLGETLHNVRDRERTIIGDALLNPNGLVESLTGNTLNVNDRLYDLQSNLNDRLQSILDQSRSSSYIQPLHYNLNHDPAQRKQLNTGKTRPVSRITSNKDSNILHRKLNSKASTPSQRLLENTRAKMPIRKIDKPISLGNTRLSKTFDSTPHRQGLLQPKESKSLASLTSAKKATILETLTNKKPLLPLLERRLVNTALSRNALPDRNSITRNLGREQKFSPSESVYRSVPVEETPKESVSVQRQNIDDKKLKESLTPQQFLKKSLLPNIAENSFLSKVKEAVNRESLSNSNIGHHNDVVPSPSEAVRSAEPQKENIAFNCKMVCDKA